MCIYTIIYIGINKKRCRRENKNIIKLNRKSVSRKKWKICSLNMGLNKIKKMSIYISSKAAWKLQVHK